MDSKLREYIEEIQEKLDRLKLYIYDGEVVCTSLGIHVIKKFLKNEFKNSKIESIIINLDKLPLSLLLSFTVYTYIHNTKTSIFQKIYSHKDRVIKVNELFFYEDLTIEVEILKDPRIDKDEIPHFSLPWAVILKKNL